MSTHNQSHAPLYAQAAITVSLLYSDFDVPNILIHSEKFKKRIAKYGMVIGSSANSLDAYPSIEENVENGYFAFTSDTSNVLDFLVEDIRQKSQRRNFTSKAKDRDYIYLRMRAGLRKYALGLAIQNLTSSARNNLSLLGFTDTAWQLLNHKKKPFPLLTWMYRVARFPVQPPTRCTVNECFVAEPTQPAGNIEKTPFSNLITKFTDILKHEDEYTTRYTIVKELGSIASLSSNSKTRNKIRKTLSLVMESNLNDQYGYLRGMSQEILKNISTQEKSKSASRYRSQRPKRSTSPAATSFSHPVYGK